MYPMRVVVWQAGFVSVGRLERDGPYLRLHGARTIRRWPASAGGLARVALRGPDGSTLDDPTTEEQHELAAVKIMHADEAAWASMFPA